MKLLGLFLALRTGIPYENAHPPRSAPAIAACIDAIERPIAFAVVYVWIHLLQR